MPDTDLSLVSSIDLVRELQSRYDSGVVHMLRKHDPDTDDRLIEWHGGLFPCIGLVRYTDRRLMLEVDRNTVERDGD